MPVIYLSPSTQEWNSYVTGRSEEYWMNRLADAMVPYLRSSGIQYTRNTPDMTAASSIAQSNSGNYDLHLALHSNGAPEGMYGQVRGSEVYYYPGSTEGRRAAQLIAQNLKTIYPNPSLVRAIPTTTIGEVRRTKAPSVLIELAYHDNEADARWIENNLNLIAQNLVQSLTQFFDIPFVSPQPVRKGTVNVSSGRLNIRAKPNLSSRVIAHVYNGETLDVLGRFEDWYVVNYYNNIGYANANYITLS